MRNARRRTTTALAVEKHPTRLWSLSQLVALVLGGAAIAFGVLALTRTGVDVSHLTRDHDSFLGFGHTPLLGLAEIGFGALMVLAAFGPVVGRSIMTLLGAAAVGLGVVVVAGWWSAKMSRWLSVGDRSGWLFIAVGGLALLAAFFAPVWTTGGARIVREPVEATTAEPAAADTTAAASEDATPAAPTRRRFRIRHREDPGQVPEPARR